MIQVLDFTDTDFPAKVAPRIRISLDVLKQIHRLKESLLASMLLSPRWASECALVYNGSLGHTDQLCCSRCLSLTCDCGFEFWSADQTGAHWEGGVTARLLAGLGLFLLLIKCCQGAHSACCHPDQLLPPCAFSRRGGYSHTGVDTIAHRDILLKIDLLSHS